MLPVPSAIDRRLRAAVPERTAWIESWGFLLLGLGIYLGIACYTFNPYDYVGQSLSPRGVANLAGPMGAKVAAQILGRFGVVGMLWPLVLSFWGAWTVTGFVVLPRPRRLLGLLAIAADLAGYAQILLPKLRLSEPSFGFGGMVGAGLRHALVPGFGFGGASTILGVLLAVALVLTGNLRFSSTAATFEELKFHSRRFGRRAWARLRAASWPGWTLSRGAAQDEEGEAESAVRPRRAAGPRAANRAAASAALASVPIELYYEGGPHGLPESSLFSTTKQRPVDGGREQHYSELADLLVQQLAEFKIYGEIVEVTEGPVVTTFEFRPAPGTKISKIVALGDDLARLLKAQSLRVLTGVPGRDTVGFEVASSERAMIGFGSLLADSAFRSGKRRLPIAMGVDIFGVPVIEDLADMPHLLVAGSTGSGKSVFMNTLVGSLIARHSAKTLRFVMIDPKMVEMAAYNSLPHMACPVITDPKTEARAVLEALVAEMEQRYQRFKAVGARNLESFNEVVRSRKRTDFVDFDGRWAAMPYIVLIIDEMADMMMTLGKDAETPIARLAQKARAAGIHLVIATQRPSADVVTGLIKANFPTRVAFRVMSGVDSRTILDQNGAETLVGKGDMLYLAAGGMRRLHGAFLSEGEVQAMVASTTSLKSKR